MLQSVNSHRLFFALWPTDQVRQLILNRFSSVSSQLNGVLMRPDNLHVTLHFIGRVTEQDKACMHHVAQSVHVNSFWLKLNCFGSFPKARIFWMGSNNTPLELTDLHSQLGAALGACGFQSEKRPYKPHITLLKKYRGGDISGNQSTQTDFSITTDHKASDFMTSDSMASDYISWQVSQFVLVESISDERGINYQVIEKYPLS